MNVCVHISMKGTQEVREGERERKSVGIERERRRRRRKGEGERHSCPGE